MRRSRNKPPSLGIMLAFVIGVIVVALFVRIFIEESSGGGHSSGVGIHYHSK
jgi:hypothetical protein